MKTLRVAVIGAGIVGASVAYRLCEGGARVILLDAAEPASGTTSASFAWANANRKLPKSYFELNVAGMREHHRLLRELGGDWLHGGGNLMWEEDVEGLERRVARLRSWGYPARVMSASEVRENLEPGVVLPDGAPVGFFPEEFWVDAPRLTDALVERARRGGAEVRPNAAVRSVEAGEGRLAALRLESGERLEADAAVNAAGPAAAAVATMFGRRLPLEVFPGLLVRVAAGGEPLRRLLHTPLVNVRPDGSGRLLLHHDSVDARLAGDFGGLEDPLCGVLLERARRVVPALEGAEAVEARLGRRPVPGDGLSCVGAAPGVAGYYEAVTHSGVTLGPLLGRLLAREILAGEVDPLISPFRPDRF